MIWLNVLTLKGPHLSSSKHFNLKYLFQVREGHFGVKKYQKNQASTCADAQQTFQYNFFVVLQQWLILVGTTGVSGM